VKSYDKSKETIDDYLETDENYNRANNQTTYVEALGREYREFKLIEIQNESEVEDILSFIHPIYPG
jgi:hypothetical protein